MLIGRSGGFFFLSVATHTHIHLMTKKDLKRFVSRRTGLDCYN